MFQSFSKGEWNQAQLLISEGAVWWHEAGSPKWFHVKWTYFEVKASHILGSIGEMHCVQETVYFLKHLDFLNILKVLEQY